MFNLLQVSDTTRHEVKSVRSRARVSVSALALLFVLTSCSAHVELLEDTNISLNRLAKVDSE